MAESMVAEADVQAIKEREEAFLIQVIDDKLVVLGSDKTRNSLWYSGVIP